MDIPATFINQDDSNDVIINKAFKPNTKCVFGESIANPSLKILDIERIAKLAHDHGLFLIIDNKFIIPINCKSFGSGWDIVTHSKNKYMN